MGLKEEVLQIATEMADQSAFVEGTGELRWPYRYGLMMFHYAERLREAVFDDERPLEVAEDTIDEPEGSGTGNR